jgi:uncharacterized protein (UPF0333 family)
MNTTQKVLLGAAVVAVIYFGYKKMQKNKAAQAAADAAKAQAAAAKAAAEKAAAEKK